MYWINSDKYVFFVCFFFHIWFVPMSALYLILSWSPFTCLLKIFCTILYTYICPLLHDVNNRHHKTQLHAILYLLKKPFKLQQYLKQNFYNRYKVTTIWHYSSLKWFNSTDLSIYNWIQYIHETKTTKYSFGITNGELWIAN